MGLFRAEACTQEGRESLVEGDDGLALAAEPLQKRPDLAAALGGGGGRGGGDGGGGVRRRGRVVWLGLGLGFRLGLGLG